MRQIVSTILALAVLATLVNRDSNSVATPNGNYGVTFSGFSVDNNMSAPFYGEGLLTFDGQGNLSGPINFSLNGVPTLNTPYTATYTVNPDCTGLLNGTNGSDSFAFVILGHGAEVLATDTSAPDTLNADLKKQER